MKPTNSVIFMNNYRIDIINVFKNRSEVDIIPERKNVAAFACNE